MGRRKQPPREPNWLCRMLSVIPFPLRPSVAELLMPIERSFGVKLQGREFPWQAVEVDAADFTAGELHDWVCAQLRAQGRRVPFSSWHRVQSVLADQLGIAPGTVRRESYVQRDLRFFEGG